MARASASTPSTETLEEDAGPPGPLCFCCLSDLSHAFVCSINVRTAHSFEMPLTSDQSANIADRERVWEVRRFCQVRSAHSQASRGKNEVQLETAGADGALKALMRCLLYELDADIASLTLLDDETQHFLSIEHKASLHNPTIKSTGWYGCERIAHRGGICEKTINLDNGPGEHPVFEIHDLSADEETKDLPIVDGTLANFRHYAGVSLNAPNGHNVGTMFIFSNKVSHELLAPEKCQYMRETARYAMNQLVQTLEALDNRRSFRCNSAVSSMLDCAIPQDVLASTLKPAGLAPPTALLVSNIYNTAADLMAQAFELDGVFIQEFPPAGKAAKLHQPTKPKLLARLCHSTQDHPGPIEDNVAQQLLEKFPFGAIVHMISNEEGGFCIASKIGTPQSHERVQLKLCGQFPAADQFLFMPLRDSFHDRDSAFVLGYANSTSRVFSSRTDLPPLSSFGMAIMTQVRRLEAQLLSRSKSDFLGSMSHEMRSPLHGILACLELLQQTDCSAHQFDLLESAEACGLQLRENIDNILLYANIGSPSPSTDRPQQPNFPDFQEDVSQGRNNILALVEDTIGRDARKNKSTTPAASNGDNLLWRNDNRKVNNRSIDSATHTIITVDANPNSDFSLMRYSGISVIINNLLGNCIKFTGTDACIRVSLFTDDQNVRLRFVDAGRGMSSDYLKNSLLVPFAQQNPLDTGTGLGLTLVQRAVQALDGETKIDTDEARGTEVSVSLPRSRLVAGACKPVPGTASDEITEIGRNLSSHSVRLLAPLRWSTPGDLRHQHCLEALTDSLARTLRTWLNLELRVWEQTEDMPSIMFFLNTDFDHLKEISGESFEGMRKVILCPDAQAETTIRTLNPGTFTTIVGPVTPSKVCAAMQVCFENVQNEREERDRSRRSSVASSSDPSASTFEDETRSMTSTITEPDLVKEAASNQLSRQLSKELPDRTNGESPKPPAEPKFLLVDDNAINLKVVCMYAKKCSKVPAVSASGGQEAIDAFRSCLSPVDDEGAPKGFDIILLDLSMPEVSGFDVAAAVREMEAVTDGPRTYIAALTGLVSDKDREAAFTAGVDEYVTKPAKLKDLQAVVTNWRSARELPP
ncbi:hypothetical protein Q7P37_007834 [Cladosporium fusiforme]